MLFFSTGNAILDLRSLLNYTHRRLPLKTRSGHSMIGYTSFGTVVCVRELTPLHRMSRKRGLQYLPGWRPIPWSER